MAGRQKSRHRRRRKLISPAEGLFTMLGRLRDAAHSLAAIVAARLGYPRQIRVAARQSKQLRAIQNANAYHAGLWFDGRDEALIMHRLMALIALALTALTLGGGILAAARLLSLGEMRPVIAGMCLVLAGRLATEL